MTAITLTPQITATLNPAELAAAIQIPPPNDGLLLALCYLLGFACGATLASVFPL